MQQRSQIAARSCLTTGQVARHCQVSIPAVKRWIQDGRLAVFKTPGGHSRIEIQELQRFLRQYGMPSYPASAPELRILIVDDEPSVIDFFVDLLTRDPRGVKLDTATDGYEALIKVGMFQPAVLILDLFMPRLDGIAVCRHLKENPETQDIKILGITGYPRLIPALLEAGADACLAKPLELRDIRQAIDRLLASLEVPR